MSSQEIFSMVFQLVLTGGIGIITYFLKRVMDELDKCRSDIDDIKGRYVAKDEFDKAKSDITEVKQNYLTKEDFYREQVKTEQKLDKIMDILMQMKGER
ncbi:hypothetical protein [Ruminococcus flavefaciens]|uniref:hypothetical protein n=1 Tax=Ruminococcus flavefaciens TaxID=1265 RepID=UPI0026F01BEB|nr:hypothetical protein [Ruminococcus flavefaciens]